MLDSGISSELLTNQQSLFSGLKSNEKMKMTEQNICSKFPQILDIILDFFLITDSE